MLVLPDEPITDYHTDKSGITAETLKGCTNKLHDAQQKFLELVEEDMILVGHALENDLKALKIVHSNCIDTGALFPHPKVILPLPSPLPIFHLIDIEGHALWYAVFPILMVSSQAEIK